jgi:Flp pilus assembly protein TadD
VDLHTVRNCLRARGKAIAATVGLLAILLATPAVAMDSEDDKEKSSATESALVKARAHIAASSWQAAIGELELVLGEDPPNPDVLNLLGYSYRNLSKFDDALVYYQRALELAPEHRGANEYLGELYLMTNQLPKAKERLGVLDKACFLPCKEYADLEASIKKYEMDKGS